MSAGILLPFNTNSHWLLNASVRHGNVILHNSNSCQRSPRWFLCGSGVPVSVLARFHWTDITDTLLIRFDWITTPCKWSHDWIIVVSLLTWELTQHICCVWMSDQQPLVVPRARTRRTWRHGEAGFHFLCLQSLEHTLDTLTLTTQILVQTSSLDVFMVEQATYRDPL